jgi:hypothetical protein
MIVRRSAIGERAKPAEEIEFLAAEPSDIHEGFGTRQHCEQRQQEHLIARIHDLAMLARVRHVLEVIEKYDRFAKCSTVRCHIVHCRPPPGESRGSA